jgi:hypothetical protein
MTSADSMARRRALGIALAAAAGLGASASIRTVAAPPARAGSDPRHDFDFIAGTWHAHHRRLKERLANSTEWVEFEGTSVAQSLLGGVANMDENVFEIPGAAYRGISLRCFDPASRQWAIWWLDERYPHTIDAPVVGGFENGIGTFVCDDTLRGQPIKVRYLLTPLTPSTRRWEQAFSPDGGHTWETNWVTLFSRTRPEAAGWLRNRAADAATTWA